MNIFFALSFGLSIFALYCVDRAAQLSGKRLWTIFWDG
jgi:hypothetical protein